MKTPRTDAERRALKKAKSYPPDPVSAKFARQLEHELNCALYELALARFDMQEAYRIAKKIAG